jgi:hypothetical protein
MSFTKPSIMRRRLIQSRRRKTAGRYNVYKISLGML